MQRDLVSGVGAPAQPVDRLRGAAGALDPMLQHVTDLACEMLDCERASLRMLDDSRSRLLVAARTGLPIHEPTDPEFRVGEGSP